MKSRLQKWGNSNGIRIPKKIIEDLNIKEDEILNLEIEDNRLIITKSKRKSFDEITKNYSGSYVCEEYEPYKKVGNELW